MSLLSLGIMSGTSADGVDCVLFDCLNKKIEQSIYQPFSPELSNWILECNQTAQIEFKELLRLEKELTSQYAKAVLLLLEKNKIEASQIEVIGCHGQTVYHQASLGGTFQLCDGANLAFLTGVEVVCDFRRADMARKGQGAPLAPLIHQEFFLQENPQRAVVNVGGIANVSLLGESGQLLGFDVGPGNALIDAWVKEKWQLPYDKNGDLASQGRVLPTLLARLKQDPWFLKKGPKSLDRSDFSLAWLSSHLKGLEVKKIDVLKTLVAFSVELICNAIKSYNDEVNEILLCGGGAKNETLKEILSTNNFTVKTTTELGIDADFIEAALFAWLGLKRINKQSIDWRSVTGACKPGVYGAHYLP